MWLCWVGRLKHDVFESGENGNSNGFTWHTRESKGIKKAFCLFVLESLSSWDLSQGSWERSRFGGLESGGVTRGCRGLRKCSGGAGCGLGVWRLACGRIST